jgi:hypothetical protein
MSGLKLLTKEPLEAQATPAESVFTPKVWSVLSAKNRYYIFKKACWHDGNMGTVHRA